MKANSGITNEHGQEVENIPSKSLADEYELFTKMRNVHRNIERSDFYNGHKFLETQLVEVDGFKGIVEERIPWQGHYTSASPASFLELEKGIEMSQNKNDSHGFIKELMEYHEGMITYLRENINPFLEKYHDSGTSDFITSLTEQHEKMALFLRLH
jgi:starvation-inducible DNA-binding protein